MFQKNWYHSRYTVCFSKLDIIWYRTNQAVVRPLTSHLVNHPQKTFSNGLLYMGSQFCPTSKIIHSLALCGSWMPSRDLTECNNWWGRMVRETPRYPSCRHALMKYTHTHTHTHTHTAGEEAGRQLHKNVATNIEQVLATTPNKAPTIRPPASHHENYLSKTNQTCRMSS